ncbi:MAG: metallophosphoesterase [Deltaproteobacteria bacterium]|nr:metallophosphoesterase [Deltaproteobacteria bacterium]
MPTDVSNRPRPLVWLVTAGISLLLGCGGIGVRSDASAPPDLPPQADASPPPEDGSSLPDAAQDGSDAEAETADATTVDEPELVGAPLVFNPTARGFGLNAVVATREPSSLRARIRPAGAPLWGESVAPTVRGTDIAEWHFDGLAPRARYEYEILLPGADAGSAVYAGSAVTQRPTGAPFTFALITDSHIGADLTYTNQGDPATLQAVSAEVAAASPDFVIHLGDMVDFHQYGFNDPPPDSSITRLAYLNYRTLLGDTVGRVAHYPVIGNWEGENGCYTTDEIAWSMQMRWLYVPSPGPTTYPEGGGPNEDYYAFTWGDALFVVLNVMSYTPTAHLLSMNPGLPDDWTLGQAQLDWLATTLANATSTWRFLFIHHPVGGKAGDDSNSAYGRGGGQAAYVGEQATVHQLMLRHGARIFFYGHDHGFTDMTVDGIHYSLPGNAGAPWTFSQSETGYSQYWPVSGWAEVTVAPDKVDVRFIEMGGELLYEYSLP